MTMTRHARTGRQRHPEKAQRPTRRLRKPDWIRVKSPTSRGLPAYPRHPAREPAGDGPRGGGLPERRRVLVAGPCDDDDHGRGLTRGRDVLQRGDRAARRARRVRAGAGGGGGREAGPHDVVITSVDRDDLEDGGAEHIAQTIRAVRRRNPVTMIEVLMPDFLRCPAAALEAVVAAGLDVFNHNLETVPGLYPEVRPGARISTRGLCSGSRSLIRRCSRSRGSWSGSARSGRRWGR